MLISHSPLQKQLQPEGLASRVAKQRILSLQVVYSSQPCCLQEPCCVQQPCCVRELRKRQPRCYENPTALTLGYLIMRPRTLLTWVMLIVCCCCHKELWDGSISFPSVKDGPVYPMLKEIRKEALKHRSSAFREFDQVLSWLPL